MNCGSAVIDECVGTTFPLDQGSTTYNVETRSSQLLAEIISVGTFMVTLTLASATQSFTVNQIKGVNMLRCGIFSVLQNGWRLLAAAYYAARQFGMEAELQGYINEFYPYLCTCK